ncbi:MAG: hypothetical protein IPP90_00360 [Gemmatimonadaceae bacterium]|nr:hypothetical protein [Gemmatimonadaceae bacterium]
MRAAYATAVNLARAAARLAPSGEGKLARALRARRGIVARVSANARLARDVARPLVWMHAPSVGEGLQARPVAQALKARHPEWQLAYTFFSPSAESFATSVGADITDYLPFDHAADIDALLDALQPSILVFAKLDVWPVLVERATARGIPVALISGTLAATSSRRGWWSRHIVHDAYTNLTAVGAIDIEHAERLAGLGVQPAALSVTGDTRFDQVWARAQSVDRASTLLAPLVSARPTLVAGSTWPADEAALLATWPPPLDSSSDALLAAPRLIIAPHEPTAAHCASIEEWARGASLRLMRLSAITGRPSADDADVILVDRVGVLGDLYALADMAFVGGGFHAAGLHSVIEPAAFGVPVLFGPRYDNSREAELLIAAGGAHAVSDSDHLGAQLHRWLADPAQRQGEGAAARAVVERERGATARSVALIEQAMRRTSVTETTRSHAPSPG